MKQNSQNPDDARWRDERLRSIDAMVKSYRRRRCFLLAELASAATAKQKDEFILHARGCCNLRTRPLENGWKWAFSTILSAAGRERTRISSWTLSVFLERDTGFLLQIGSGLSPTLAGAVVE
jgi:hypothetical protein